jgi:hypothetical protein
MKIAAAFSLAVAGLSSPAIAADKPVELSATELAAAQSRTYGVPAGTAFSAVVATLQSLSYVDINASKDAGTISGVTETKGKLIYNIFWGFGKKKLTQKASLLVEDNGGTGSRVQLNLHVNEAKQRGIFGTAFTDGKLVKVAEPYSSFFTALDAEVAKRAPAPAATAVAAPVAPAAAAPSAETPAQAAPAEASAPAAPSGN